MRRYRSRVGRGGKMVVRRLSVDLIAESEELAGKEMKAKRELKSAEVGLMASAAIVEHLNP